MEIILFVPARGHGAVGVYPYVNGERLHGIREIRNATANNLDDYKYGVYENIEDEDGHKLKITIPDERVKIHDGILDIGDEVKEPPI